MNKSTNLHTLWDSGILDHRIITDFHGNSSLYYDHIYQIMMNQSSTNNDSDIQQWITENLKIVCEEIYFNDNNTKMNSSITFNLGEMYYRRSISIIEQRLAQGGRRLGALLNRLGQNRPIKSAKDKLYLSIYILIVILSAEFILH
jgi:hypothetical protein